MMDKGNGLYPELTEEGKEQAQTAINNVREGMKKAALNVIEQELSDCYTDIAKWVESDSWLNYRNSIIQEIAGYRSLNKSESKVIRDRILMENRDSLIKDLNNDLIEKVDQLEKQISYMRDTSR